MRNPLSLIRGTRSLDNGKVTPTPPSNRNPFETSVTSKSGYRRIESWLATRGLMTKTMDSYEYASVPPNGWKRYQSMSARYRKGKPLTVGGSFGWIEGPVVWHYATEGESSMIRDALWIEAFRMVEATGDWLTGAEWLIDRWEAIHDKRVGSSA